MNSCDASEEIVMWSKIVGDFLNSSETSESS